MLDPPWSEWPAMTTRAGAVIASWPTALLALREQARRELPASRQLNFVTSLALGVLLLDERFGITSGLGAVMTLAGIVWLSW